MHIAKWEEYIFREVRKCMSKLADADKILLMHLSVSIRVCFRFYEQISVSILKETYIIYSIQLQL